MAKTQRKKEPLETKESKKDVKINEKGEIKAPLDFSAIKPDEIFSYLGEKYVVQMKQTQKLDEHGAPIPREFIVPAGKLTDGYVKGKAIPELYNVVTKVTSPGKTLSDFGKPLNVRVTYTGQIDADEVFTVPNKPIMYDNTKLRDKEQLALRDGKIVVTAAS